MLEIRTLADIKRYSAQKTISKDFEEYIKSYFVELKQNLEPNKKIESFSLESHGHILIINSKDNYTEIEELGLDKDDTLLSLTPEFVNEISLNYGKEKYLLAGILCNNEFMLLLYLSLPFDAEVEEYFREYIII